MPEENRPEGQRNHFDGSHADQVDFSSLVNPPLSAVRIPESANRLSGSHSVAMTTAKAHGQ
jgi:hypothetical protein